MNTKTSSEKQQALIFGMNGAIASALAQQLADDYNVTGVGRRAVEGPSFYAEQRVTDYSEPSLAVISQLFQDRQQSFSLIINTVGVLHTERIQPEKRLADLSSIGMEQYFAINAIIPGLILKYFHALLPKRAPSVFACLSAKVGSIGDNWLGGWYGYRASKAALNMLVKNAAIEIARVRKQAAVVVVHPGTTESELSAPFTTHTPEDKLYPPALTAERLTNIFNHLSAADTGRFINWSGEDLPW